MTRKGDDQGRSTNFQARVALQAERTIKASLMVLGLPIRGSYTAAEAQEILGIGKTVFWRFVKAFELDESGRLVRPDCLRCIILGKHRRVPFLELVEFIRRNDEYQRNNGREKQRPGEDE
jgi:hypothetical protein